MIARARILLELDEADGPASDRRVVAERVELRGHTLRWLVSRIDQNRPYYLLGEVEMPEGRGPALTGRLDSVDTYNPASSCLTGNPETS